MRRTILRSLLGGAVALSATASPAFPQVQAQVMPCKLTLRLNGGATAVEDIVVRNRGPEPVVVRVRWLDWRLDPEGEMAFVPAGTTAATLLDAVSIEPSSFSLGPNEQKPVRLRIRMPADGPATRWGLMLSEVRPTAWRPGGLGPRVSAELGTTVYATRKDEVPQAVVEAFDIVPQGDTTLAFSLRIANRGERHFYVAGEASMSDSTGATVTRGDFTPGVLLPTGERVFRVRVPAPLGGGHYVASVRLDTGQPELLVVERRIAWPGKADPQLARWSR